MIYGADKIVQMPIMQLYDTGLMQSAIQNARYMYEKAEKRMDDFYEKYGEFMSPFQKDMDRYNQIVGNIKGVVDNLYATGEDPLRTASGRAKMAAALRSVNPAEFAAMKANAKMGYAYLDAAQKLRSSGKYSEAQELFDIMQNHGKTIGEFATYNPDTGTFNTWDRSAPIEAVSLRDLTQEAYKGRTARILTQNDFSDPRLAGYKYDPKYEWTGYLYSDLLKNAPGASLAIAGDPRAAFFRDQARQMVIARGEEPTAAAVEKQFQKNIADANTWALIDPDRKADEFALDDYRTRNDIRAHRAKAAIDYEYAHKDDKDNSDDGYSLLKDVYSTSIAQAAGIPYPPKGGFNLNQLSEMLNIAKKRQIEAVKTTGNVLSATGQYISRDKINGIIPSEGANGRGHFLSPWAILNLRTDQAVRSSIQGWRNPGRPENTKAEKERMNKHSQKIAEALYNKNGEGGFSVKVVPISDKNGNNVYPMVGDDNKWHVYTRVKVYLSNGKDTKKTTLVSADKNIKDDKGVVISKDGMEMLLPVGLQSNEGKVSPDLSLREREKVGINPYMTVKKWIGQTGDEDFPWGTNIIKE